MDSLPILQSGFIAFKDTVLQKPDQVNDSSLIISIKLGKVTKNQPNPYFFSKKITDLFTALHNNGKLADDFDFRQDVFLAVFEIMGDEGVFFTKWLGLQQKSQFFSSMHSNFLTDTLRMLSGEKRVIQIDSWFNMLNLQESTTDTDSAVFDYEAFFENGLTNTVKANVLPRKLSDLLQVWVFNSDGFKDMLCFMAIVFGRKTVTSVM